MIEPIDHNDEDTIPELDMEKARPAGHLLRLGLETPEEYAIRSKVVDDVRARGIIILDPDVAAAFPANESLNDGLRELLRLRGRP